MELRELRYFLAIAEAESISGAAEALFITQPNLSRQMQNLEREAGQQLFVRGSRKITLTEAGKLLRKRAEEIMELVQKTENELVGADGDVRGTISIGCGESYAVRLIARAAKRMKERYPAVTFRFFSADTNDVTEKLDCGLIDFGILIQPSDVSAYENMRLPLLDTWGVWMRKDDVLARKSEICPEDLDGQPLILSKHSFNERLIADWLGRSPDEENVVAFYNLLYNASLLVEEGMGYAIGLDRLINTSGDSELCFRPLSPSIKTHLNIVWKKHAPLSKPAAQFIQCVKEIFEDRQLYLSY